ncbi:MAG: FAD-binding protein [Deltaproteobacteria bacterium]|nr:FAD-binding protein [Deltaproteobacteria bacterium]
MKINDTAKTIETDILILGSGAAGCGAAIGAWQNGVRAVVVDKGKIESSGCLGGGNDHFMAVLGTDTERDSKEALINFYRGPTTGYTPQMISKWFEAMPPILRFLEDIGVEFVKKPDGSLLRTPGFGQPGDWYINIRNGQLIKRRLADKIRGMDGIKIVDHVMVTKLLTHGGRIAGAIGYDVLDGTLYLFRAKCVILALGNSANRATANSTGNPYNSWHSPFNTGSQFILAYEAGAKLINLDLKQQATLIPKGFGSAGMNGINSVGAHELNALGERFLGKYHPMMEKGPRRFQILGTFQEQVQGRGPPFYMDMRHCNREDLYHLQYVLMPGDKATFLDYCEQAGIDFEKYPMEVELSEIELSGMILTRDNFESTLQGLYNGCVFYSFSGSMCSGHIAANEASVAIPTISELPGISEDEVKEEKEKIFRPLRVRDGIGYDLFERAIRQVMTYYMGYIRNRKGMETALEKFNYIESYAEKLEASNFHELMRANEAVHLLKTCELSTRATLERRESGRSIYRRSDYPEINPELDKPLVLWQENGELNISWGYGRK